MRPLKRSDSSRGGRPARPHDSHGEHDSHVRTVFRQPVLWRVGRPRHVARSLALLVAGPAVALASVGAVAHSVRSTRGQSLAGGTAVLVAAIYVASFVGAVICVTVAARRLRRYAAVGTEQYIVVSAKRKITVPTAAVAQVVVMTLADMASMRVPALVLTNGAVVAVTDGASINRDHETVTTDVDSKEGETRSDRAWTTARALRASLTLAPTSSRRSATFGYDLLRKRVAFPRTALASCSSADVGVTSRIRKRLPLVGLYAFGFGYWVQPGSPREFHLSNYLGAVTLLGFGTLAAIYIVFRLTLGELRVGPDWIGVRRNHARRWTVLHRDAVIGVIAIQWKNEKRNRYGPSLRLCDITGDSLLLPGLFLRDDVAVCLQALFADSDALTPFARETLATAAQGTLRTAPSKRR